MPKRLIFVDTNILLDFYRVRRETSLSLLQKLNKIKGGIITSYQVEMEFLTNRQQVITDSLKSLSSTPRIELPAFAGKTMSGSALAKAAKNADSRKKEFRKRVLAALDRPANSDPVYKEARAIFVKDTPRNLNRTKKIRHQMKRLAFRRFMLGYPPRKSRDVSMGDALNWEWIVHVSKMEKADVVIVSRDSDFGVEVSGKHYINDWLCQEFRDRTSRQRKITLTPHLAKALKTVGTAVAKAAEEEEEDLVRSPRPAYESISSISRIWDEQQALRTALGSTLVSPTYVSHPSVLSSLADIFALRANELPEDTAQSE